MLTTSACRAASVELSRLDGVASRTELANLGFGSKQISAQLAAGRWRRSGLAIVLHNAEPTFRQRCRIALVNCGPRALLTSFTAAQLYGLRGWERPEVHVLAPRGAARPVLAGLRLHRVGDWATVTTRRSALHDLPAALVIAASSFDSARPACGLLAAAVQQRCVRAAALRAAVEPASRTRHRRLMLLALGDIAQGADALSEIDLGRLCVRFGLPRPRRQAVRVSPGGRRRYLDGEWLRADGRRVAVEVDGVHHMAVDQWSADLLRQNEIVVDGTTVLRFPAVLVRTEPALVAAQLRRALRL